MQMQPLPQACLPDVTDPALSLLQAVTALRALPPLKSSLPLAGMQSTIAFLDDPSLAAARAEEADAIAEGIADVGRALQGTLTSSAEVAWFMRTSRALSQKAEAWLAAGAGAACSS